MGLISKIKVEDATKLFGRVRALAGVSLSIESGEAAAVMGGNGAGKSTLLSLLSLSSKPSRGKVLFNDTEPSKIENVRGRIGLLAHDPMVYPDLSAKENLFFFAGLLGVEDVERAVQKQVTDLAIHDFFDDRPCRVLSRGQLQRVSLARALLAEPDLLLLDEPAAGLDSRAVSRIEKAVVDLRDRGGMAVVVTHEPEVAFRIATRAVMLRRGKVVTDEPSPQDAAGWRSLYFTAQEGKVP